MYDSFPLFSAVVNCDPLAQPRHGTVSLPNVGYSYTATYSCDPGHVLEGAGVATCQENGRWSSGPPTCRGDMRERERDEILADCLFVCGALFRALFKGRVFNIHWVSPRMVDIASESSNQFPIRLCLSNSGTPLFEMRTPL